MIVSSDFTTSKWAKEAGGKKVNSIFMSENFWRNLVYTIKFIGPLVKVLRLVDGDKKPAMDYIYEVVKRAKNTIKESFSSEVDYSKAFEIIDKRWECQLRRPLHVTRYYLNPEYYYEDEDKANSGEISGGVMDCISRLIPDVKTQDLVSHQLDAYKDATGLFGHAMAIRQRKSKSPADWWSDFGGDTPELQKFAIRVLSLTCSANCALKRRYQRADTIEPILLNDIDESNEWVMGCMDEENEERDATDCMNDESNECVNEEAIGALESAYSTRSIGKNVTTSSSTAPNPRLQLIDENDEDIEEEYIGVRDDGMEDEIFGLTLMVMILKKAYNFRL
ncbi:uncharacterized protein LOC143629738 [Bidens hawaiensis]|uniref:uncharacterized protein LOC143629738 n=1 Tax=Bidens hawaiensis TaxID=980011 RepID=UPI00404B889E